MENDRLALARRIERAEARLVVDIARGVLERSPREGGFLQEFGGGAAVCAGADSPLTKWTGLGLWGPPDERLIADLEARFAASGCPVRIELCEWAERSWIELLTGRGYREIGREEVLALELDGGSRRRLEDQERARPPEISVECVAAADAARWLDLVVTGFLAPDGSAATPPTESFPREALERAFADTLGVSGFTLHAARIRGELAGGGGSRRLEGLVQLCGASTLPEHRGRGVQSALLSARLLDAARAGADLAVVTTEPGSRSQRNARARGFEPAYGRRVLVRG
jgi:GNAT superfamily N-acetyltransferase